MPNGVCPTCGRGSSRGVAVWVVGAIAFLLLLTCIGLAVLSLWMFGSDSSENLVPATRVESSPR